MGKILSINDINNRFREKGLTLNLLSVDGTKGSSKCKVYCSKCKATYEITRQILLLFNGCSVCNGKKVIKGINDIVTTSEWMLEYLADKNDGYKYTKSSNKKIRLICPNCKREKITTLNNLNKNGFVCNYCNDGISFPNKFIRNFLLQFNLDKLDFEYSPIWIKPKRFDAYFVLNGKEYIVEMDGSFHTKDNIFNNKKVTKEEVQAIDIFKQNKAEEKNIEVIRIDCIDTDKIIENIKNSKLSLLFNLSNFDFDKCYIESLKSELIKVCNDWTYNNLTVFELIKKYCVSKTTILKWLNKGKKLNICSYNKEESNIRGRIYAKNSYAKSEKHLNSVKRKNEYGNKVEQNKINRKIYVYKNDKLFMICDSYADCAEKLSKLLNRKCSKQNIRQGTIKGTVRYGFTYKTFEMLEKENRKEQR